MQDSQEVQTAEFDLRTAKMPRGYASHLAVKLNIPKKRVYKVRYGEQEDKQVELCLLELLIEFREEQEQLIESIKNAKKRIKGHVPENQMSLF